jgi:RNA 2',3'-cyclic 3'-phosphodiesterase
MTETESKKTARVFFALWPDEDERAAMAAWQPPLQQLCGGRLTPADQLHNTLVFLGNVEFGHLEALQLAAQEVSGAAFQLNFDTARYWGHNHIVYAAPATVPKNLTQLVGDLEQRLQHHRFKFDQRSYKPHITLLRHAQWSDSPLPTMPRVLWKIRDFALVQSISDGQGVRYEVLARLPSNVT